MLMNKLLLEAMRTTARDFFAKAAMQGLLAYGGWLPTTEPVGVHENAARSVAKAAYAYADAMLEARKQ